ncbi:MAG TPA: patatin-like phospholipase family protein [Rhizomicrobium sp.]|jgi:NTE family protein
MARSSFDTTALLLQGGGALGAYQAGVYEALAEAGMQPNWVAGISIGALNGAIIAGNAPDERVRQLRAFWEEITARPGLDWFANALPGLTNSDTARQTFAQWSAGMAAMTGVSGFFSPRLVPPWLQRDGTLDATSWYDTGPLRETLKRYIDFDRLNRGGTRYSAGAVNVRSGNFAYFDTTQDTIEERHVLASGALPPGFPAVEIKGEYYWDGGLVSNTPLQWVLEFGARADTLAFEVDLWSAKGAFPRNMAEVATRQKEILYSSRTRDNTNQFRKLQCLRHGVAKILDDLPDSAKNSATAQHLRTFADDKVYNIVHLIYRSKRYEGESKDYEFSRPSMQDHWQAGLNDTRHALTHPEIFARPVNHDGVATFDFGARE